MLIFAHFSLRFINSNACIPFYFVLQAAMNISQKENQNLAQLFLHRQDSLNTPLFYVLVEESNQNLSKQSEGDIVRFTATSSRISYPFLIDDQKLFFIWIFFPRININNISMFFNSILHIFWNKIYEHHTRLTTPFD